MKTWIGSFGVEHQGDDGSAPGVPGKRSLTMGMAPSPRGDAVVSCKVEPGAGAARDAQTRMLLDAALRPDLCSEPLPGPGGGDALPAPVQAKMEDAMGADFGAVRVHVDDGPARLGAAAYASGSDLHFAPGTYDPSSQAGQALIGHELVHVVQQRAGRTAMPQGKDARIDRDAGLEAEADALGAAAAAGERVQIVGSTSAAGSAPRGAVQLGQGSGQHAPRPTRANDTARDNVKDWSRTDTDLLARTLTPWQLQNLCDQATARCMKANLSQLVVDISSVARGEQDGPTKEHAPLSMAAYTRLCAKLHEHAKRMRQPGNDKDAELLAVQREVFIELLSQLASAEPPEGCEQLEVGDFFPDQPFVYVRDKNRDSQAVPLAHGEPASDNNNASNNNNATGEAAPGTDYAAPDGLFFLDKSGRVHNISLVVETIQNVGFVNPFSGNRWGDDDAGSLMQYRAVWDAVVARIAALESQRPQGGHMRPSLAVINQIYAIANALGNRLDNDKNEIPRALNSRAAYEKLENMVKDQPDAWVLAFAMPVVTTDHDMLKILEEHGTGGTNITIEGLLAAMAADNCQNTIAGSIREIAKTLAGLPSRSENGVLDDPLADLRKAAALATQGPKRIRLAADPVIAKADANAGPLHRMGTWS
jgi:hypothetical protein